MGRFASSTSVSVERTKIEIERMLQKYQASAFGIGWDSDKAMVTFKVKSLQIRFLLPYPGRKNERYKTKKVRGFTRSLTETQKEEVYEQDVKARWRALNLVIKAKLEAVECGISTIEDEFMSYIVMPNADDTTIGEWVKQRMMDEIKGGNRPLALGAKRVHVQEAEIA